MNLLPLMFVPTIEQVLLYVAVGTLPAIGLWLAWMIRND
jgi:hypothetical protein